MDSKLGNTMRGKVIQISNLGSFEAEEIKPKRANSQNNLLAPMALEKPEFQMPIDLNHIRSRSFTENTKRIKNVIPLQIHEEKESFSGSA